MWVSSLVLLAVILVVVLAMLWINSATVMTQTVVLTNLILDEGGELPDAGDFDASQRTFLALTPESIHEARYFSVILDEGGGRVVTMRVAGIAEDEAIALAEEANTRKASFGRLHVGSRLMHYCRRALVDGGTLLAFLDSTSRDSLLRVAVLYMGALWVFVLLMYVLIMGRYSKRLIKPFVENDEKQKRFITNASHELKTPLAVISANTEMTEVLGGKSKWTESTRRQVSRMQALIEDLVVLTRMDELKDMELQDVDLSAVVSEAAGHYRTVAESSGRRFECDISQDVHVKGDRRALAQIATILLDNAAKYCDEGGEIRVTLRPKGRGARLQVANTYAEGAGVDTDRFFERFYRQDESHHSGKSGFGIGLSMAREIAGRMKGRLKAACSGNVITFTLDV